MIRQSPESSMPEPYKTYVRQRNHRIGDILQTVVGKTDVQLCPRAITPDERIFNSPDSLVYGAVVHNPADGHKSALYTRGITTHGIVTADPEQAAQYAAVQFKNNNRVRLKDPRESDGQGQYVAETISDLRTAFDAITHRNEFGCVLMPNLASLQHRISVGHIALGAYGHYTYIGREHAALHQDTEVYGGTTLGLFSSRDRRAAAERLLDIPPHLTDLGLTALQAYMNIAISGSRVSVDVIEGYTDNGELIRDVVDVTPRVGGTTPAEVLALSEIYPNANGLALASSMLHYDPPRTPTANGIDFVDTPSLRITAQIHEVYV